MNARYFLLLLAAVLAAAPACLPLNEEGRQGDYFFVRSLGADLPVWVRGNLSAGTFLVVLPGGPGGSGIWAYPDSPGLRDLERDYAVVYMDQCGTGNSQGNPDRATISLDQ